MDGPENLRRKCSISVPDREKAEIGDEKNMDDPVADR
jgi:hypothetical protein